MIDLETNIRDIARSLNRFENDTLAKVKSKSAEDATRYAATKAARSGQRALDDPIPAVFQKKKSRNRVGWIYYEWDDRRDIQRQRGNVEAKVQLQGLASSEEARREQREAIHRQIFGTRETKGVTPSVPYIIRPSGRLLREKSIPGVPLKIDKFGNLRNYQRNIKKMLSDPQGRFFQVKIGGPTGGKSNNGLKLEPGLYMRKLRVRKYKRNKHTKRKGGPYGGGAKKKATVSIITILRYSRIRDYKKSWNFRDEVKASLSRRYSASFVRFLRQEIARNRR